MTALSFKVASAFENQYEMIRGKIHELVAPLSTEQIWRRPYPYGNSIGHLLLHLTGNLNYYIGAQIADTGYIRHRDREFTDTENKVKEQVLADFDGVDLLAFVAKDRTGGTDFQVRQLGKTIDERLSQSIGKIVGVRFCASVLERQDGD